MAKWQNSATLKSLTKTNSKLKKCKIKWFIIKTVQFLIVHYEKIAILNSSATTIATATNALAITTI